MLIELWNDLTVNGISRKLWSVRIRYPGIKVYKIAYRVLYGRDKA